MSTSKKILLAVGITIFAAAATFGVIFLINKLLSDGNTNNPNNQQSVLDLSNDYGACTMFSVEDVKASLGSAVSDVQAPENMGIVGNTEESDSQICVYAFEPGGTIENGFHSNNGLVIKKTIYANNEDFKTELEEVRQDPTLTEINDLGESAFYSAVTSSRGPSATHQFMLLVFKNDTYNSYKISQPAESASFTPQSAQQALTSLARQSTDN